jgi:hypothetical protein
MTNLGGWRMGNDRKTQAKAKVTERRIKRRKAKLPPISQMEDV